MATLGKVFKQKDGSYSGEVKTLTMQRPVPIAIKPITGKKESDKHPDFAVHAGSSEVGAGWNKKNRETGAPYVSLTLEAPEFSAKKLYCNLGKTPGGKENEFSVIWNAQR